MVQMHPTGALPAHQERSQETARRIVDAVEMLLKQKTFDQLTMVEIAATAGLTPGAIYRRFKNKEALLPHIFDRYRTILGAWTERVSTEAVLAKCTTLDKAIERVVRETNESFKANAHIFRTVHLYGRLHPAVRMTDADQPSNVCFTPIDEIVLHFASEIEGTSLRKIRMIGHVLLSSITERTLYPENLPAAALKVSDRQFVSDLSTMLVSWLRR